jgi:hypothetical protein
VPPEFTEVAIVTWSADPEEEKSASFANVMRISFEWHNWGSSAAANKQEKQALASQEYRNRAKENQSLMADVDA